MEHVEVVGSFELQYKYTVCVSAKHYRISHVLLRLPICAIMLVDNWIRRLTDCSVFSHAAQSQKAVQLLFGRKLYFCPDPRVRGLVSVSVQWLQH